MITTNHDLDTRNEESSKNINGKQCVSNEGEQTPKHLPNKRNKSELLIDLSLLVNHPALKT
jgi:hypothetical protein